MGKYSAVAHELDGYIRFRAEKEGVGYNFTPEFFEQAMRDGCISFFGVEYNSKRLLRDNQQPEIFESWKTRKLN